MPNCHTSLNSHQWCMTVLVFLHLKMSTTQQCVSSSAFIFVSLRGIMIVICHFNCLLMMVRLKLFLCVPWSFVLLMSCLLIVPYWHVWILLLWINDLYILHNIHCSKSLTNRHVAYIFPTLLIFSVFFSLFSSNWIISTDLSSSLLTLSSVIPILLVSHTLNYLFWDICLFSS